jgi:hypothetical protein
MPIVPRVYVDQSQIATKVEKARKALSPDVVRIRYDIGEDWSGSPSVFFRIVLSDAASRVANLRDVTQRVSRRIEAEVGPDKLGLEAYFNFRSVSEQRTMKEPAWE